MVQLGFKSDEGIGKSEFFKVVRMVQETDAEYFTRTNLVNPDLAAHFIRSKVDDSANEVFGVICLDIRNKPTSWAIVNSGSISECQVHLRNVFLPALISGAAAIIIFHNHPSGDPQPSGADLHITENIVKVGRLLGVAVLDHIIIGSGSNEYVSFQTDGRMPNPKNL